MVDITDKIVNERILKRTVDRFREKGIILPTLKQQKDPSSIPGKILKQLKNTGLWDVHPLNLFRISWKNEPREFGGLFGGVNYIEIPKQISGVDARIIMLAGKWFPTGAHKVGAAYGSLVPRIISGIFDPTVHKAVWPSTGNFCRGGAFDSSVMGCKGVAILPEEMSIERFEWLEEIGAEIIKTPGSESNVKEIYDKVWEIRRTKPEYFIFNHFEDFSNSVWYYEVTGKALAEVYNSEKGPSSTLAAFVASVGSGGTIAAGDYLKTISPQTKIVASEALQCPTLLMNGFGSHRIEGIGDKHVPWILNVRNIDLVTATSDEDCMRLFRLFNEEQGHRYLRSQHTDEETISILHLLGISGIANLLSAIKTAKYYEMTSDDIILTVATDSASLYRSRLKDLSRDRGKYNEIQAARDHERCLMGVSVDFMKELTYHERKALHNLKYFTWVEQQQKEEDDLNRLWYDREIWPRLMGQADQWDELINEFNDRTGLAKNA